ncbi:hypothetical protein [Peribacillus sp. SI8-4]|uniref:hypothetical protein n=1 Tax=Peribacillus sp. SI8-4 TaxID=3048009 RepID=UPI0025560A0E|nr:hypothetical protein [Peribacillus sp. SI8-4]
MMCAFHTPLAAIYRLFLALLANFAALLANFMLLLSGSGIAPIHTAYRQLVSHSH